MLLNIPLMGGMDILSEAVLSSNIFFYCYTFSELVSRS